MLDEITRNVLSREEVSRYLEGNDGEGADVIILRRGS